MDTARHYVKQRIGIQPKVGLEVQKGPFSVEAEVGIGPAQEDDRSDIAKYLAEGDRSEEPPPAKSSWVMEGFARIMAVYRRRF